jgi:hypothetical protein
MWWMDRIYDVKAGSRDAKGIIGCLLEVKYFIVYIGKVHQ